jgi:dTDP-3-amino-3,4,6-trideoxy-alpha-D-glucose transaminase
VSAGGLKSGGVDSAVEPVPLTLMDNHDPELVAELIDAIQGVASTGAFTGGLVVERFEHAFAEWCETTHAIGVSSGTEALTLVLRALGVKDGDEVIVPANSFIATAEAVSLAGAVPRFADVDPVTQLVTAETIGRASSPRVRGIIPVHLFGRTAEMSEIMALARRRGSDYGRSGYCRERAASALPRRAPALPPPDDRYDRPP